MITREDFDSGKLDLLDAEAYLTGLREDGLYGKAPEIDMILAKRNYPVLFGLETSPTPYGINHKIKEEQDAHERLARRGYRD